MKLEKGKVYKILGNDVYINNKGFKCAQYSELELKSKNGLAIAERYGLSYKYKATDVYDGIYYSKKDAGGWITYYIDENFDGLSRITFKNESSVRLSVTTIVLDKIYKCIKVYFEFEQISDNQELKKEYGGRQEFIYPKGVRLTDKYVLEKAKELLKI